MSGWGQVKLFAASLWLTLATAVFCAVVPAGLPHTAPLGSAFNPSTSAVALHASDRTRASLERSERSDPAAKATLVVPAEMASLPARIASPSLAPVSAPAALALSSTPSARYPRGPPTA